MKYHSPRPARPRWWQVHPPERDLGDLQAEFASASAKGGEPALDKLGSHPRRMPWLSGQVHFWRLAHDRRQDAHRLPQQDLGSRTLSFGWCAPRLCYHGTFQRPWHRTRGKGIARHGRSKRTLSQLAPPSGAREGLARARHRGTSGRREITMNGGRNGESGARVSGVISEASSMVLRLLRHHHSQRP